MVAALFFVYDALADEPVRLHHDRIDGTIALCLGLREDCLDVANAIRSEIGDEQ